MKTKTAKNIFLFLILVLAGEGFSQVYFMQKQNVNIIKKMIVLLNGVTISIVLNREKIKEKVVVKLCATSLEYVGRGSAIGNSFDWVSSKVVARPISSGVSISGGGPTLEILGLSENESDIFVRQVNMASRYVRMERPYNSDNKNGNWELFYKNFSQIK